MAPNTTSQPADKLNLPDSLVSRVDASRLARELENLRDSLQQQAHQSGKAVLPQLSEVLEEMANLNKLELGQTADLNKLYDFLQALKQKAPTIHMSFAAEPSSAFTARIISWLRSEVNPLMLLDIGLQPSIAAGCVIRTNSKYFDCSVRQHLITNKAKLLELMRGVQHA